MRIQSVQPTGNAQHFGVHELFFSTTDARGVMTAGNAVFTRTSGYSLEELIGQPHNLIRHPKMPRAVFATLWSTIQAGRLFMGYVLNQSRNGSHYWVFAVIIPLPSGFLSVRFKPSQAGVARSERLYAGLLQREEELIASGSSQSLAAERACKSLEQELRTAGFKSYEAFSHACLNQEIKARDAEIAKGHERLFPETLAGDSDQTFKGLSELYSEGQDAYEALNGLFQGLDAFLRLNENIKAQADSVLRIADEFRLNAMNAHIASDLLGGQGATLSMVATFLSTYAKTLADNVAKLSGSILEISGDLESIASNLSSARLTLEMTLFYLAEISRAGEGTNLRSILAMLHDLDEAFGLTIGHALEAFASLRVHLPNIEGNSDALGKDVISLHVAQISGMSEAARVQDAEVIRGMYGDFRAQIDKASGELQKLADVSEQLIGLTNKTPARIRRIDETVERMRESLSSHAGEA